MKKRILSLVLALVLALGLAVPSLAAGPTFTDVPETHWAYADVETAAAEGLMKGTGGGAFSPDMKVSVAQFLTLVGRVVFPEVKAEGDDWYGPYIQEAQAKGLLDGTQVDASKPEAEISRYDMAVILRGAAKKLGAAEKAAQSSQVADYGLVPTMYADAVLAVYGMGLIQGDQNGNFYGSNTMMRSEVVTVVVRLFKLKSSGGGTPGGTTTPEPSPSPEPSPKPEIPTEPVMVTADVYGSLWYYPTQGKGSWDRGDTNVIQQSVPFKIFYTEDGGKTSALVFEAESEKSGEFDLQFPIDKRLLDNPDGQFYLSTQVEKDGQLFVTQDLRTDGRKALCPVNVFEKGHGIGASFVYLVPPTGQKWNFELNGKMPNEAMSLAASTSANIPPDWHTVSPAGFIVQLVCYPEPNLQNGIPAGKRIILGETTATEDGTFVLPVSIDTLDLVNTKNFRIEFSGRYNGNDYFSKASDNLRTLGDIKSEAINAAWGVNLYHN